MVEAYFGKELSSSKADLCLYIRHLHAYYEVCLTRKESLCLPLESLLLGQPQEHGGERDDRQDQPVVRVGARGLGDEGAEARMDLDGGLEGGGGAAGNGNVARCGARAGRRRGGGDEAGRAGW